MAEISLRAYVKEVDNLVEQEQLDEAIAHCRHILDTYPKHVDTYRVLGKAYLEAKRFGDAADIFQRVLSAIPDDFVAHIGMAIVREDEGNLDAAIWHIERAFETNPSNPAIQQELRRLIGRRDGLEPHKVRMTRGALARMYAHGELYPQAIAELTSALKDDSDRPDLEALLATMYWRSDHHAEAAEICNRILEKLPHCREANRILAASLQSSNKAEEAKLYHRRLAALDPYAAFVETANIDPQTVDTDSVRLEKLEWEPGRPMPAVEPGQPEWAASLGVDLGDDEAKEPVEPEISEKPSWLEDLEKPVEPVEAEVQAEPVEPSIEPMPSPEPTTEPEIPDWMREAGWQEATGEVVEAPVSFTEEELTALEEGEPSARGEPAEEGELAPADIPGWLQDIAPTEPEPETPELAVVAERGGDEEEEDFPDWLSEIDEDMAGIQPEEEKLPSVEPEAPMEEVAVEVREEEVTGELIPEAAELIEEEERPGLPTWLESETPGATTTIVTWLGDREAPETELRSDEIHEEIPEVVTTEPVSEIREEEAEIPSWLAEAELEGEEVAADMEAAPPWLAEVAELTAQEEEELEEAVMPEPVEPLGEEEAPSWLSEVAEIAVEEVPELEVAAPEAAEPIEEEEAPSWLSEVAEVTAEEVPELEVAAPEAVEPIKEEEAPSWLAGVAEVAAEEVPELEVATPEVIEPIEEEEAPSWLAGVAEIAAEQEAPPPSEELPPEPTPTPAVSEDDVPEWLRSISEPGPEPSIGPTPVEEAPDWLEGIAEPEAEIPSEPAMPTPEAPEWLKGIAESEVEEAPSEEITPVEEAADWLAGIAEPEGDVLAGEPTGEAPDWLKEFTTAAEEEPEPLVQELTAEAPEEVDLMAPMVEAEEAPEAVTPIEEPAVAMVLPTEAEHPADVISGEELDDDEVLGWLEGLAARQGVEEEELITAPEERLTELPSEIEMPSEVAVIESKEIPEEPEEGLEWLERLATERGLDIDVTAPTPAGPSEMEVIEPEAPEWLDQMATQPIPKISFDLEPEIPDWLTQEEAVEPSLPPTEPTPVEPEVEVVMPVEPPQPEPTPIEPEAEVEPEAPPEPIAVEREPEIEPELPPVVEPPPVEAISEVEPEAPSPLEPSVVEPEFAIEPEAPRPPEPITFEPEPEIKPEVPTVVEEIPVEPIGEIEPTAPPPTEHPAIGLEVEAEPEIPPTIEPMPIEPTAEVEPELPPAVEPLPSKPAEEIEPEAPAEPVPLESMVEVGAAVPLTPEPTEELPTVEPVPLEPEIEAEPEKPIPIEPIPVEPTTEIEPEAAPHPELVPATEEPVPSPPIPKERVTDPAQILDNARQALASNNIGHAVTEYRLLIKKKLELGRVIEDLRTAVERDPNEPDLWQVLGDAYMENDQLTEAINAYQRGMEVA